MTSKTTKIIYHCQKSVLLIIANLLCTALLRAQDTLSIKEQQIEEVQVVARSNGIIKSSGLLNSTTINTAELLRAACCDLGESFTTNPSVDVSYTDAATGARQIKLLGLSGSYVQMLTENIPNYRGVAMPYALGYIPGPWMQSIQVSKGSSSVKNGYESITGQINVEFKKPQSADQVSGNLYGSTMGKIEANADGNIHLNDKLSTGLLLHYQDNLSSHDDNKDGFLDEPDVRQFNLQNRWAWISPQYIFQAGIKALKENREGGQTSHRHRATSMPATGELFKTRMETNRYEAFMKNAYIFDPEHNSNIALILSGSLHDAEAAYGHKGYDVTQKNFYASLLFETDFTEAHKLSAGLSFNHDHYKELYLPDFSADMRPAHTREQESTSGAYLQYTYNWQEKLVLMGGIRMDHNRAFGTFVTPRAHLKYAPSDIFSVRLSAGKGYRTVHALAELNNLLASGRQLAIDPLKQEQAWNYGLSTTFHLPIAGKTLNLNAEYYYTNFSQQAVVDYDSNPSVIHVTNLDGKSYSHTVQIDATYPLFRGFTLTAAYRLNDVKSTYGGKLMERPLTSKSKGLLTVSYSTPLGIWQFDATLQLNGGGRMPTPDAAQPLWQERFHGYEQLSAQVTRFFRHWSIYAGGENLTGFKQKNPIIGAENPWNSTFDPTLIWGPVTGAMAYIGIRINLE